MGNDYHEFAKEGQNIRVKRYHKKDDRRIRFPTLNPHPTHKPHTHTHTNVHNRLP
jgi:hypothetical protein